MIYIFYLHATIRREYMVLFHVIFLVCSTIEPKIRDITDLFLLDTYDHSTYSTIHIHACVSIILSLSTTIRPKMRVLIIFFLFVYDHSTKVRSHSYYLIYTFLDCTIISFAIFMTDTTLIFRTLCFK